jgi:hypothetical protein
MRIRILSVTVMKTPDVARGAREAMAVVSDPCIRSYIANGGYSRAKTSPPSLPSLRPTQGFIAGTRVVGKAVSGRCFAFWNAVLSVEAQGPAINENSCGRRSRLNS